MLRTEVERDPESHDEPQPAGRRRTARPGKYLQYAIAGVLIILIVPVIVTVILASFRPGIELPFDPGTWTLDNYRALLFDTLTHRLLLNTVMYVAVSLALGMSIAIGMVWLIERTDLPFRNSIPALLFIPLVIPGALSAMGWVLLFSPRVGFINLWLRDLIGSTSPEGPINIYSFAGLVWITATGIVPSMFFMLSASFKNMDSQLEDAGRASGAGNLRTARKITLPLMLPTVAAAGIYYAILLSELFEIPLVIGFNANFRVLSIYVYDLVRSETRLPQYGLAAAFGTLSILVGIAMATFYLKIAKRAYRYAVVKGQRTASRPIKLGKWKYVAFAGVVGYFIFSDLLPLLALIWSSLFTTFTVPSWEALGDISLDVYRLVLADDRFVEAARNTAVLVVCASVGTVVLATLVSWVVVRTKTPWLRSLDALAFLPRAVPGVILALGLLLLALRTPLYNTIWILVIAHMIAFLPYSVRSMNAALIQLHPELEEAARASGANTSRTIRLVVFPLLRRGVVNTGLWVAAHSARDFTYVLMLGGAVNVVVSQLLWSSWSLARRERTAAMAVLLIGVLLIFVLPLRYRISRSGDVT